jgi:fumarylacetoacetase
MDPTTDPALRAFIEVDAAGHFPIQNLPFGAFRPRGGGGVRAGIRIGDFALDLRAVEELGWFDDCAHLPRGTFAGGGLDCFLALGRPAWREARAAVSKLLRADNPQLRDDAALRNRLLLPVSTIDMQLPATIGDYTDFYSSREHATNVGVMFRGKDNALMPNWLHLPVAYHGRASSIVPSGTPVRRPCGQMLPEAARPPVYGPSRELDFELEVGFLTGPGNALGEPIPIGRAEEHIFGLVLVNDWSARDIQRWEYQPLGPFNAKNFAASVSPWVVSLDALEPFRCAGPAQDPEPLPYLRTKQRGSFDIQLEVWLQPGGATQATRIAASNFRHLYWSMAQQLAHHTVTGCNLRPGDLRASGTISAPDEGGYGSLLELAWKGTRPVSIAGGGARTFLEDHDTVTISGWCERGGVRIGFGEVAGSVLPALSPG